MKKISSGSTGLYKRLFPLAWFDFFMSRITLRLVRPGRFGADVSFTPASKRSFNPFAKNEIADDLIVRVDQARLRRAG